MTVSESHLRRALSGKASAFTRMARVPPGEVTRAIAYRPGPELSSRQGYGPRGGEDSEVCPRGGKVVAAKPAERYKSLAGEVTRAIAYRPGPELSSPQGYGRAAAKRKQCGPRGGGAAGGRSAQAHSVPPGPGTLIAAGVWPRGEKAAGVWPRGEKAAESGPRGDKNVRA